MNKYGKTNGHHCFCLTINGKESANFDKESDVDEIIYLHQDKERLDWLSDINQNIGGVQLPKKCVEDNLHSLRAAIDDAMKLDERLKV